MTAGNGQFPFKEPHYAGVRFPRATHKEVSYLYAK